MTSFSPPKGIRCFSTLVGFRLDSVASLGFQSPEGDSLFFYPKVTFSKAMLVKQIVSVPRRGFVVFLRGTGVHQETWLDIPCFSPPKGIRCFSTQISGRCPMTAQELHVSVPRRGFVVFLHGAVGRRSCPWPMFQSPEGDSLFFYTE